MIVLGPSNQARARGGRPRRNAPVILVSYLAAASCPACDNEKSLAVWCRDPSLPAHRLGHRVIECPCGATWLGAEWIFASGAGDCYRGEVAP